MGLPRHITTVFTTAIMLVLYGFSEAKPLTQAELTVCENLNHCLDIVNRHSPETYDYTVLSQEFLRFGTKGRQTLLNKLTSKKAETSRRALMLLNQSNFRFSPEDQRHIASQWRKSPSRYLAPLMTRVYAPITRQALLSTLSHEDKAVRYLSRQALARGEARIGALASKNPQALFRPAQDNNAYLSLVRAVIDDPTPTLLSLLKAYPPQKTRVVFTRLLEADNPEIIIAAYEALQAIDKTSAPQILQNRFQALKGSYKKQNGKKQDDKKQQGANMFALLALVDHIENTPRLSANMPPSALAEIETILEDKWVDIWQYLNAHDPSSKSAFLKHITRFPLSAALEAINAEALSERRDYRVTQAAINNLGIYKIKAALGSLNTYAKDHPIRDIRLAALNAIDSIQGRPANIALRAKQVENGLTYCRSQSTDFKRQSRRLPYFDNFIQNDGLPLRRVDLSSATPTAQGWLASYAPKHSKGGLVYFNNETGQGDLILDATTQLITPIIRPPLGKTAKQFWALSYEAEPMIETTRLQSVVTTTPGFSFNLQAVLPSRAAGVARLEDDSLFITFAETPNSPFKNEAHPPLRVFPNGTMVLGCQSPQKRG